MKFRNFLCTDYCAVFFIERSVIWAILSNPAYQGRACFGKTAVTTRQRMTRPLRLRGGLATRNSANHELPREKWIEIPVPALVSEETLAMAQEKLIYKALCDQKPIRQVLLDQLVWTEILRLPEDPTLIENESNRRLEAARESRPTQHRLETLDRDLIRVRKSMERLLTAYQVS